MAPLPTPPDCASRRHSSSDCSSLPSTMTWAPCPHGVRTRGKKTDDTVHSLQTRVFCRCYAPRRVLAPGCREFGAQVFEECVALLQVGMNNDTVNQLAPQAELGPRAFYKCTALRHINLDGPTKFAAKLAGMLFSGSRPSRTELASRVLMDGISSCNS